MLSILLTGFDLKPHDLWRFAKAASRSTRDQIKIEISPEASARIEDSARTVSQIVEKGSPVYGVNTGFGKFAEVAIGREKLLDLQKNLLVSHACGVGAPLDRELVMAHWIIRLNTFCRGHSGIRPETVRFIIECLENGLLGVVPSRGSVGASGDLSPSAHASLPLLGLGLCTLYEGDKLTTLESSVALKNLGLKPLVPGPKEGLALINGTQTTTALATKACIEGQGLLRLSNLILALSIEGLRGSHSFLSPEILKNKNQHGTAFCGADIFEWLGGPTEISKSHKNCNKIQDPYSLRCAPLVHGAVWDDLLYTQQILENEINSSTDNPLIFPNQDSNSLSGGNFHALYPARAADQIASALCTLSVISERRIATFMSKEGSGLPPFLVADGGLNSGFMMAHVTAAALASESKTLCFPASVDSIPTSDDREDHVSMGPNAGFKANQILDNSRSVLAIEALAACQAIDFLRPLKTSDSLERVFSRMRQECAFLTGDRILSIDIQKISKLFESHLGEILNLRG